MLHEFISPNAEPTVETPRLYLRPMAAQDWRQWIEVRGQSQSHLVPWEPTWPRDALTRDAFRRRLRYYTKGARDDQVYSFLILRGEDDRLIGGATLSNVRRGVTLAASLGYWMAVDRTGRGYMTEAIVGLLGHAFDALRLNRVEAACVPQNHASRRVLEKAGFTHEGFARAYRKINGQWRDHLLFGIVATDPLPDLSAVAG